MPSAILADSPQFALHKIKANWGESARMADGIWLLLRDWHRPFYRWGQGDPQNIASAIEQNITALGAIRDRTIVTLSASDEVQIRSLFRAFAQATRRTNKNGSQPSSVGAAKVLHLLSPAFLPIWD